MGMSNKGYIDSSLEKAVEKLKAKGRYGHVHSERCKREICHVLGNDEETILEIKQSHLRNITPERFIATNKRLIIVRPSFFGHYLGFDLLNHTEISFVPYNQIVSIVMSRGKMLSTIHMRIHGYTDVGTSPIRNEGAVEGIRTMQATRFTIFVEDIIEGRNGRENNFKDDSLSGRIIESNDHERGVDLHEARGIIGQRGTKFVWLGVEPVIEFAAVLGVGVDNIMRFNAGSAPN